MIKPITQNLISEGPSFRTSVTCNSYTPGKCWLCALGIYHVAALFACEDHQLVKPISLTELAPSSSRILCCQDITT